MQRRRIWSIGSGGRESGPLIGCRYQHGMEDRPLPNRVQHVGDSPSHFGVPIVVRHPHQHRTANGESAALPRPTSYSANSIPPPEAAQGRLSISHIIVRVHISKAMDITTLTSGQTRCLHVESNWAFDRVSGPRVRGRFVRHWRFRHPPSSLFAFRRCGGGGGGGGATSGCRQRRAHGVNSDDDLLLLSPPPRPAQR